jgi:hypothetical protein
VTVLASVLGGLTRQVEVLRQLEAREGPVYDQLRFRSRESRAAWVAAGSPAKIQPVLTPDPEGGYRTIYYQAAAYKRGEYVLVSEEQIRAWSAWMRIKAESCTTDAEKTERWRLRYRREALPPGRSTRMEQAPSARRSPCDHPGNMSDDSRPTRLDRVFTSSAAKHVGVVVGLGVLALLILGHTTGRVGWGDTATWVAAIGGISAFFVGVRQLTLQRRQLAEQEDTIAKEYERQAKRDELLDAQLDQVRAQYRATLRAQAEQVELAQAVNTSSGVRLYFAQVSNRSSRPIRDVAGWIRPSFDLSAEPARSAGNNGESSAETVLALVRGGAHCAFTFEVHADEYSRAEVFVEFADDAGLRWRLDHDLSLTQIADFTPL